MAARVGPPATPNRESRQARKGAAAAAAVCAGAGTARVAAQLPSEPAGRRFPAPGSASAQHKTYCNLMSYQVLARKWRPRAFADMVGQSHVLKALANALDQDRLHHAYLFSGTRGVGKTTLARILARCLNCEAGVSSRPCGACPACAAIDEGRFVDLIEVDAASRAKVDETRDLMDNVQYAPSGGRYKIYLIDEIHMFSNHSFNALLKTLEEPPPHVKFLLATTEPGKLPVTILSRCLQFNLSHLTHAQIAEQIQMILGRESVAFDPASVELIARGAAGSMRDALSLLDQAIAHGGGKLQEAEVRAMLGTIDRADLSGLLQALADGDAEALLDHTGRIAGQNPDYDALLAEFLGLLHQIAVLQMLPEEADHPRRDDSVLSGFAATLDKEDVQLYYQIGMLGRKDLYFAPDLKSGFEMILIRMLAFRPEAAGKTGAGQATETRAAQPATALAPAQDRAVAPRRPAMAAGGWQEMIEAMALSGLVKELAGHCALKSRTADRIELALAPAQESLFGKNQKAQLAEALKARFGAHLKVRIVAEAPAALTPAEAAAKLAEARQAEARQSVNSDPVVQTLLDTFDATLDQDSIRPEQDKINLQERSRQ